MESITLKVKKSKIKKNKIKPYLKWVGGKTQILEKVLNKFPKKIENYHEIFLGGGSVLFGLLNKINNNVITLNGKIYAYDINKALIYTYKNIQNNHIELFENIQKIIKEYDSCKFIEINRKAKTIDEAKTSKESYYYWLRTQYNNLEDKTSIQASTLFIILNKLCFRGVYREGPNGFNVPYGHYKILRIFKN